MLSKIVGIIAVFVFLAISNTAVAHPKHKKQRVHSHSTVVVTIGWTWVEATFFRPAHWHHPHYGRSYRVMNAGPPPARPNAHAVWVPGRWEGRRHNRHWVPGHWRR